MSELIKKVTIIKYEWQLTEAELLAIQVALNLAMKSNADYLRGYSFYDLHDQIFKARYS
jgi:hypothetical protein